MKGYFRLTLVIALFLVITLSAPEWILIAPIPYLMFAVPAWLVMCKLYKHDEKSKHKAKSLFPAPKNKRTAA